MKALIAGAGIGGLTTALFLHEAGIEVELFERADDIRELGVGINMLPHAVKALAGLGLMPALDAEGVRTRELVYTNRFGQIVWQELRGIDAGYEVPQISIHRGRLLGLIHRAVVNRLGGDVISTASRVDAFEQNEGEVVAHFRRHDGSRGEAHGDLLIGADGIHSAVRAVLYPEEGPPIWNGTMLWRGATPWPVWRDGRTMAVAGGNFAKFVYYPIEPDREETRLTNWAVMANT
ncbi:flavin-dependent oxidoreductase, partial [Mesorhizobium sp. M7A.F.Ca.CA.001.08.2.1]